MDYRARQGLIIGTIAGIALCAFMYMYNQSPVSFILIPVGAIMGCAPFMLKPKDE